MATKTQTRKPQGSQDDAERFTSTVLEIGNSFTSGEYTGLEVTMADGTEGVNYTKDPDKYQDPIQQAFEEGTEVEYSTAQGQKGLKIYFYFPELEQAQPQQRPSSNGKSTPVRKSGVSAKEDKTPAKKPGVQYVSAKDAYWENKFEWEKEYAANRDFAIAHQEWGKIVSPMLVTAIAAGELSVDDAVKHLSKYVKALCKEHTIQ